MSDNRLVFEGLDELREALRNLPQELAAEAGHLVEAATNGAAATIKAAYPVRTGNLRDHVTAETVNQGVSVVGTVKNTSKLAYIFENGTQARHTDIGANRGAMPPGHVFIPAVAARRRWLYEQLKDVVRRAGLEVSGDA